MLTYKYDANSRLTEASDPAATYTFTYDNLGRNTSTEHDLAALGFDVVIDEAYDALGRRTSLAAEIDGTDDLINSYAYDYQNRMTQVTQGSQSGGNVVAEKRANFSYDAEDKYQFTSISRYADLSGTELVANSTYGYDAADRITSLTHADSGSSTLAGYTWGYDEGNRLTDFTVAGYSAEDATYTYDDTDQLTGADRSGTTSDESYTYDENGNRTGGSYSTGDNNQILSDGTYTYTYDDEGNRLTKTNISSGEVIEYEWDYRDRLVGITTKASGGTVTYEVKYTYDIFNRRIVKTIDADGAGPGTANEEVYIYDGLREERGNAGDHILLAFDESDDLTDRFLYGANVDQILAIEEVTSTAAAGDTLWALTDHLGTVRDVVDYDAGINTTMVQNHLTYDAFGNVTSETNPAVDFLFAFTGRERDEESDLLYFRGRYYDPSLGKWISEDPIGFKAGDTNLARYVANVPTRNIDPSGLQTVSYGRDPDDYVIVADPHQNPDGTILPPIEDGWENNNPFIPWQEEGWRLGDNIKYKYITIKETGRGYRTERFYEDGRCFERTIAKEFTRSARIQQTYRQWERDSEIVRDIKEKKAKLLAAQELAQVSRKAERLFLDASTNQFVGGSVMLVAGAAVVIATGPTVVGGIVGVTLMVGGAAMLTFSGTWSQAADYFKDQAVNAELEVNRLQTELLAIMINTDLTNNDNLVDYGGWQLTAEIMTGSHPWKPTSGSEFSVGLREIACPTK